MMSRTVFQQGVADAVMKMALLILRIQKRLGEDPYGPAPIICSFGMKLVDEMEACTTLAEYQTYLPRALEFFQTNLNNEFPRKEDLKRYFREEGIDLGLDFETWG
jgi:hypothetical protein